MARYGTVWATHALGVGVHYALVGGRQGLLARRGPNARIHARVRRKGHAARSTRCDATPRDFIRNDCRARWRGNVRCSCERGAAASVAYRSTPASGSGQPQRGPRGSAHTPRRAAQRSTARHCALQQGTATNSREQGRPDRGAARGRHVREGGVRRRATTRVMPPAQSQQCAPIRHGLGQLCVQRGNRGGAVAR